MADPSRTEMDFEYCSDVNRRNQTPLRGTAPHCQNWLLLEYNERWEAKARENNQLAEEVLGKLTDPALQAKLLFIRRGRDLNPHQLTFFAAAADPINPRIYEITLEAYQDILDLDLPTILGDAEGASPYLRSRPLFLVCTNGRRDRCCAHYGVEHYQVMREAGGEDVWQSTHIGGHNKAPVTLFFPHGLNYGLTSPEEILDLMESYRQGMVGVDRLRGRVCYPPEVQAAASFWRQEKGDRSLPGFRVIDVESVSENVWEISLLGLADQERWDCQIKMERSGPEFPTTCSGDKREVPPVFQRI